MSKFTNARIVGSNMTRDRYPNVGLPRGDAKLSISQSDLKIISSNSHKWRFGPEQEDTDATRFGALLDCILLTPEQFAARYAVIPETYHDEKTGAEKPWTFAANICKAWREQHEGKDHVKTAEMGDAQRAVEVLKADPDIFALLTGAQCQVLITADFMAENGVIVPVAGLIDVVPAGGPCLADVKTAADGSAGGWARQVFSRGMHVQAAFYLDLWNAANPDDQRSEFRHIVVENETPFEVGRRLLDAEFITLGRDHYEHALEKYARCLKSGNWPTFDLAGEWTLTSAEPWMLMRQGKEKLRDQYAELTGEK